MKPLKQVALVLLVIAAVLTGIGGWLDMYGQTALQFNRGLSISPLGGCSGQGTGQFTKQHAWNDGLFLAIVAVFLLLL